MALTITVSHAVKEEPGGIRVAVLDKGHVVASFDAEHSEQLHPLAGKSALSACTVLQLLGHRQLTVPMGFPPRMEVNLVQYKEEHSITQNVW